VQNSNILPDDPEELKKQLLDAHNVIQSLRINNEQKEKRLNEQENLIIRLNEMLKNLKRNFMGIIYSVVLI
jgi:hypothetical protein